MLCVYFNIHRNEDGELVMFFFFFFRVPHSRTEHHIISVSVCPFSPEKVLTHCLKPTHMCWCWLDFASLH